MQQAPGPTTVTAKPVMSTSRMVAVVPRLMQVAVIGFMGFFLRNWLVAGLVALVAVVNLPLQRRFRRRAVDFSPDRLEVTPERLTLLGPGGYGSELTHESGGLVAFSRKSQGPHLRVLGPAGRSGVLGLQRFDVDDVRAACLANGWSWQDQDSGSTLAPSTSPVVTASPTSPDALPSASYPDAPPLAPPQAATPGDGGRRPTEPSPHRPGVEIVLRGGPDHTQPNRALIGAGIVLSMLAVAVAVVGLAVWEQPAFAVLVGLPPLAFVLPGVLAIRLSRVAVTISPQRVAVRYGSLSANLVQRPSVVTGIVGRRWVRFKDSRGRQLLWVPLRPRRDEVLATLTTHGWPL